MARRKVPIEIFAPIEGLHTELSSSMITKMSTPYVQDCNAYYGVVQKDYGTSLFASSTSIQPASPCSLIFEAVFPEASIVEALNQTGMHQYVSTAIGFQNDGQVYSGTYSECWNACMHNDKMVYTNGVELVQYKPAYNSTGTDMAGVEVSSLKAHAVVSFKNHLNLYHTIESGSESYKRVRWTKVGTLTYTASDWTTGTANFIDIQDADGEILTAAPIAGGGVAIYAEGSVHQQEWVGGADVYRFTKMLSNLDIASRRCVTTNGDINYLMTRDNIYEYRGGRTLISIGDAIREKFVSEVNPSMMKNSFLQYIRNDNELRCYVPTGTSTYPSTCFICKIQEGYKWFQADHPYTAAGQHTRPASLTIGELVGKIGAQNWKFGDMNVNAGAPIEIMSDVDGNIIKKDKTVYSLSISKTSTAQSFVFDTKDLSANKDIDPATKDRYKLSEYADNDSRWLTIKCEANGEGSLGAEYSIDGGSTFTVAVEGDKTLTSDWELYTWDVDVASELFRVRFTNTGQNEIPHIRFVKVEFIPGSEVGK